MSQLHNPFWQDLSGRPKTGNKPVTLNVLSGRMTPQRHGEIQQIYMRFSLAKLTAVGEFFVFNRVLTDGTRVRMESMQGQDRVFVWASDAAEKDEELDYGWSFTPANDNHLDGFIRRPGAAADDFSSSAFLGQGSFGNYGKKVNTFVNAKNGNRSLCTDREGGSRMWRSTKAHTKNGDKETLTYDHNAVYVNGVKHVLNFHGDSGFATHIDGAAIAKRLAEKWLVFVVGGERRLGAIKIKELKPINTSYIDCGAVSDEVTNSLWEFSPDAMNAISVAGRGQIPAYSSDGKEGIFRFKMTAQNGTVPFYIEFTKEMRDDAGIRKRVVNTFHFNQASRNFKFNGWGEFSLRKIRTYGAIKKTGFTGGWGPDMVYGNETTPFHKDSGYIQLHRFAGNYYDPLVSITLDYFPFRGGYADVVDPGLMRPFDEPIVINDIELAFDDGEAPKNFIYSREFVKSGVGNTPRIPDGYRGRYFYELGGWLIESGALRNIVSYSYEIKPPERVSHYSAIHCCLGIQQTTNYLHEEKFNSLLELGSYCDANWGNVLNNNETILGKIQKNYQPVLTAQFNDYLDMHEKLYDLRFNLIDADKNYSDYATKSVNLDLTGGQVAFLEEGASASGDRVTEEWGTRYVERDGEMVEETYLARRLTVSPIATNFTSFIFGARITADPIYTLNWTTDWVLESQVYLSGKAYITAGYDSEGKERFLYFEGDESKQLKYTSSAQGRDVPDVDLSWTFSGEFGCNLKIDNELIDSYRYSVFDTVTRSAASGMAFSVSYSGSNPNITSDEIFVHDYDLSIGHVLYRKSNQVYSVNAPLPYERLSIINYTHTDYLRTPKAIHKLGESVKISSDKRKVVEEVKFFSNTKYLFANTAPFMNAPDTIVVDGISIKNQTFTYIPEFEDILPSGQRYQYGPKSGKVLQTYDLAWLHYMMLYYPGVDNEVCPIPRALPHNSAFPIASMERFGYFEKNPEFNLRLRAFNDDCWMVCYQNEMFVQSTDNRNTTAKYFLKLGKDKPINEFDAANYFQFLGASKKLLRPKFHIRKRT